MPGSTDTRGAHSGRSYVNDLEIRQIGMSRSGNHALQHWILHQVQGRACLLNCSEPGTNPFVSARPMDEQGRVAWASYGGFDLAAERRGRLSSKDLLLFSHEDCFLGTLSRAGEFEDRHDEWVGRSRRRLDLLLLRDPFNLFASRLSSGIGYRYAHAAVRIWKQHAREYLGLRRHLRGDRLLVSYNRWASSRDYRREVAEALGLEFDDEARSKVPMVAAGSSFDGGSYDGRAHDMSVHERWHWFRHHPRQLEIFDDATVDLAERIFGADFCAPIRELMEFAEASGT